MIPNNYPMAALNLICFALVLTPLTQARIEPENIVGIWLFNQGAGKMAQDSSDNGNHGELKGGVKWVDGKFGKALAFDGNDDWVNMGDNPILKPETNADGNVTFMAWYKWEGAGTFYPPEDKHLQPGLQSLMIPTPRKSGLASIPGKNQLEPVTLPTRPWARVGII